MAAQELEVLERMPPGEAHSTPLLFVHGAWHGAWCWNDHFLPYFAEHGYRAFAPSLRGHGGSAPRPHLRTARIADYVSDVGEVADGLAARLGRRPVLIGHSMGGLVVQKCMEEQEAPAGVLLAPVPPAGVLRTTLSTARRHPLRFLRANATWSLLPMVGTPALTRESFFSPDVPDAEIERHFSRIQDESYLAFLDMLALALPRPQKIRAPVLVLGAERDAIFTTGEVAATARAYRTQEQIFAGMAHDMMLEPGWRDVADAILAWLGGRGL